MTTSFLSKFFQLSLPEPGERCPGGADAKSDLKLLLEIATHSRLKQGQDKKNQNKQIFYCRSLGKDCFKIEVEFFKDGTYKVLDDYTKIRHREGCQKSGESPNVIKVYNLMMLKRGLIEQFMERHGLLDSSPELILQRISGDNGDYFYCNEISDMESRRKLKKRFDNIINISIKKKKEALLRNQEIEIRKEQRQEKCQRKGGRNRKKMENKQNIQYLNVMEREDNSVRASFKQLQKIGSQRVRSRLDSNSSINFYRISENDEQRYRIPSEVFPFKGDSIFQQEQEDYFKKKSDMCIKLNMLNDIGSNNFWPESERSIGANSDRMRVDDLFASLIRNSLLRSLEKKSNTELEPIPNNVDLNPQDIS